MYTDSAARAMLEAFFFDNTIHVFYTWLPSLMTNHLGISLLDNV